MEPGTGLKLALVARWRIWEPRAVARAVHSYDIDNDVHWAMYGVTRGVPHARYHHWDWDPYNALYGLLFEGLFVTSERLGLPPDTRRYDNPDLNARIRRAKNATHFNREQHYKSDGHKHIAHDVGLPYSDTRQFISTLYQQTDWRDQESRAVFVNVLDAVVAEARLAPKPAAVIG